MNYSVAIRTLGKSPETLRQELESIAQQTILPDKVVIYIAEGYDKPSFNVMNEVYVETKKGMIAQRAVDYKEIDSDCILLLDDDVELSSDSAEILLKQLNINNADCVAADTFKNHEMSVWGKTKAIIGNLVFPHFDQKWAFKLRSNGSFSYINNPVLDSYPSQSAAGPASLWRKKSLLSVYFKDEEWLDRLGFAYGDDDLEFFKLHINGGRLFVSFNSGIKNLDAKTASFDYHRNERKPYVRGMSNYIRWYRMQFQSRERFSQRLFAQYNFWLKQLWMVILYSAISVSTHNFKPLNYFVEGLRDGKRYVKSDEYLKIPDYKNENIILR